MISSSCGPRLSSSSHLATLKSPLICLILIFSMNVSGAAQTARMDALPDAPSAQQSSQQSGTQDSAHDQTSLTVPVGTRFILVLTHPVDSRSTHSGDQVFAQLTAPVIVDDQVAIPPGTYVRGNVQKLTRRGTQAEMLMQSVSLVFPNGYVANAGGPINIESDQWTALSNPSGGEKAGIVAAPLAGLGLGMLIGNATDKTQTSTVNGLSLSMNSHKGLAIGSLVGLAAGGVGSLILIERSHGFYIEEGSPLTMRLPRALTLNRERVNDALQNAPAQPPVPIVARRPPPAQSPSSPATGPASCSAGQEWCNGQCVDTISFVNDSANCGRCGNQCSFSETCTGGSCSCGPGYTSCMGQCKSDADFVSDNQSCGSCGHSCGIGESCLGGTCSKIGP